MKSSKQSNSRRNYEKKDKDYFPVNIFLKQPLYEFINSEMPQLKAKIQLQQFDFTKDLIIPKIEGQAISIGDLDINKKINALKIILKKIEEFEHSINKQHKSFILLLLIPDNLVSLLIGSSGRQLSQIMKNTNTKIIINQPIYKMTHRTITILGNCTNLGFCIQEIYELFEQQGVPAEKADISYPLELEPSRKKITARFIFANNEVSALIGIKGEYVKRLNEKFDVLIKFYYDKNLQCLRKDEKICLITGELENVQKVIWKITKQQERYCFENKHQKSCEMKLIFPTQYITKLIGPKGTNIQSINQKSGGAIVRVLSDRANERESQYCLTTINGNLDQKQNAACMIVEQLELFKDGGPILKHGRKLLFLLGEQLDYDYLKSWPEFAQTKQSQVEMKKSEKQRNRSQSSSSKSKKKYSGKHSRKYSYSSNGSNSYSRSHSKSHSKKKHYKRDSRSRSSSIQSSSSKSISRSRSRSHSKSKEKRDEKQKKIYDQIVDEINQNKQSTGQQPDYQKAAENEYNQYSMETFNFFSMNKEENKIKISLLFPENIIQQLRDNQITLDGYQKETGCTISFENNKSIILPDLKTGGVLSIYGSPGPNNDTIYKIFRLVLEKLNE